MDPVGHADFSPYLTFANNPIKYSDPLGLDSTYDEYGRLATYDTGKEKGIIVYGHHPDAYGPFPASDATSVAPQHTGTTASKTVTEKATDFATGIGTGLKNLGMGLTGAGFVQDYYLWAYRPDEWSEIHSGNNDLNALLTPISNAFEWSNGNWEAGGELVGEFGGGWALGEALGLLGRSPALGGATLETVATETMVATEGGGMYIPKTPLAQQKVAGWDIPLPDPLAGKFPHTTLGGKIGSDGILYRQSATFTGGSWPLADGKIVPWSRVDWTTHGRPLVHPNPHQHIFNFNNGKNWQYGKAVPFH